MSVLSGVDKTRTTQAGQITLRTAQQDVSQTQSHDLRGNALPSSMSDPSATVVLVEHRDRLARCGVEYLEAALSAQGRRIVVADPGETTDDLVRDMIEVLTSMCARLYGRRGARNRAMRAVTATKQEPVSAR